MNATVADYFDIENYYVDKEKHCLTFFKRAARNGKKVVIAKYGPDKGDRIWIV